MCESMQSSAVIGALNEGHWAQSAFIMAKLKIILLLTCLDTGSNGSSLLSSPCKTAEGKKTHIDKGPFYFLA